MVPGTYPGGEPCQHQLTRYLQKRKLVSHSYKLMKAVQFMKSEPARLDTRQSFNENENKMRTK